jgi:hypothetical protein
VLIHDVNRRWQLHAGRALHAARSYRGRNVHARV